MEEQAEAMEAEDVKDAEKNEMDLEARMSKDSSIAVTDEDLEEKTEAPVKRYKSKFSNSHAEKEEERKHDTIDGAVAIIWYRDEKTGKVYFSFERKTRTHPSKDKLALWGGTPKGGEPHFEALVRELSEEDPKGSKIVLNALKDNGYKLTEVIEYIDGQKSRTSVWVVKIEGADTWKEYIQTKTSPEGDKAILSFGETIDALHGHSFVYPQQASALEMLLKIGMNTSTHTSSASHYSNVKVNFTPYSKTYTTSPFKAQNVQLGISYSREPFYMKRF